MNAYEGPAALPAVIKEPRRVASPGPFHPRLACRFLFLVLLAASLFSAVAATRSPIHGQDRSQAELRAQAEELRRLAQEHAQLSRAQAEELRRLAQEQELVVRAQAEELRRLALEQAESSRAQAAQTRAQSEETRRLAREQAESSRAQAAQARAQAQEIRIRARDLAREHQQVVVRVRARIKLGVELDPGQGQEYDRQGVRVKGLMTGSPAEAAGLRKDDILTHVNGRSLLEPLPDPDREGRLNQEESLPVQRLVELVAELEPGHEVEVWFVRDGRQETAAFTLEDLGRRGGIAFFPGEFGMEFPFDTTWARALRVGPDLRDLRLRLDTLGAGTWRDFSFGDPQEPFVGLLRTGRFRGLELRDLSPDLAPYFSTDRGVLVLDVDQERGLGLLPGDVILSIGDREVENVRDVRRILSSYTEEERMTFQVMRRGRQIVVEGRMG